MNQGPGFPAIVLVCSPAAMAPEVWTLEKAVNYAQGACSAGIQYSDK